MMVQKLRKLMLSSHAGGQTPSPCIGFVHGVASGDPLPDRVIIWTRYTLPGNGSGGVEVQWFMGTSASFSTSNAV